MSDATHDLYGGLDHLIAKQTRPPEAEPIAPPAPAVSPPAEEPVIKTSSTNNKKPPETKLGDSETRLVRELEPDLPDEPYLYRKQTLDFGPKDLEAVEKMQRAMSEMHKREITKAQIVRAAVEFLSKDCDAHAEQSFLCTKVCKEVVTLP